MYVVQRRESENSLWHTCSCKGKKCRYSDIAKARIAFRYQKNEWSKKLDHGKGVKERQFRIIDTLTGEEVE